MLNQTWRTRLLTTAVLLAAMAAGAIALSQSSGAGSGPSQTAAAPASQAASPARTQTPPAAPAPPYDYGRLVRVWSVPPPGLSAADYGYARPLGRRMVLSAGSPPQERFPLLASAGFTVIQTDSDHLSTEETQPGVWNFKAADLVRDAAARAGLDWCYFPHVAFPPPWYSQRIDYTRIRCLEHDQTIEAYSPWDPRFGYFASRVYQVLGRHFTRPPASTGGTALPAFYVGIHGDYGEAGFFIGARTSVPGQKEDWQARFGNLHNHVGWWCGDPEARKSFRETMLRRYGTLQALNAAWKTSFATADGIVYPTDPTSVSRRYWLDWVHWYRQSASAMTDVVCRIARRTFPDAMLILPCGFADEDPRNGADNSMLAKIAARHRMEIRSTHGAHRPVAENQATMLGRLASACRFYGVPFWTEPPGSVTPEATVGRIFEAITLGAKGYFDWTANIPAARDVYYRYARHMRISERVVDVAMFFPTTSHLLRPEGGYPKTLEQGCTLIRDILDYDIVDERMILDGALDRYRVLVLWEGGVVEADVLNRIRAWVENGGVLVAYDFGKIETVEGSTDWFRDVLGYAGRLAPAAGTPRFVPAPGRRMRDAYRVSVGLPSAAPFLHGEWFAAESSGGVARRWTGAEASVLLPVTPGVDLALFVRASFPPEAAGLRHDVLVNGISVGMIDLAGENTYRFVVPGRLTTGRDVAQVTLRSQTFVPAERIAGSGDRRNLGLWVTYVQISRDLAASALTDPGPPEGVFETRIDYQRLRTDWARRLGRGWTIYFPARKDQLRAFCEVVRYAAYNLTDLDPTQRNAVAVDNAWDGVYATLCTDKVVYYNPGKSPIARNVVLSSPARTLDVRVDAGALAVIPFTPLPDDMLFQCEKFVDLRGRRVLEGGPFSPGRGPTHVLVPESGEIATRFEIEQAGVYRVFYRTTRRDALCQAEVLLDGRPCGPLKEAIVPRPWAQTLCAGEVYLNRGIHTLTLRPLKGQDLRADFVVLTADRDVAGYTFAVR